MLFKPKEKVEMNIVIHTKDGCIWCEETKKWFTKNGFEFETIIHNDDEERKEFYESMGGDIKSVPQIFLNGRRIGGYQELMSEADELVLSKNGFTEDF